MSGSLALPLRRVLSLVTLTALAAGAPACGAETDDAATRGDAQEVVQTGPTPFDVVTYRYRATLTVGANTTPFAVCGASVRLESGSPASATSIDPLADGVTSSKAKTGSVAIAQDRSTTFETSGTFTAEAMQRDFELVLAVDCLNSGAKDEPYAWRRVTVPLDGARVDEVGGSRTVTRVVDLESTGEASSVTVDLEATAREARPVTATNCKGARDEESFFVRSHVAVDGPGFLPMGDDWVIDVDMIDRANDVTWTQSYEPAKETAAPGLRVFKYCRAVTDRSTATTPVYFSLRATEKDLFFDDTYDYNALALGRGRRLVATLESNSPLEKSLPFDLAVE